MSESGKSLFRAANVWWRCAQYFMFVYVGVISSFKNLRIGSQVFALLMLFMCVLLYYMWLGNSLQLLCILPFCMFICDVLV